MEKIKIAENLPEVSRVCLGTWAIGGWLWGGADDRNSVETIKRAVELGVNFIDTAPVYGFGRAESVVGQAIKEIGRDQVVLATKAGLEWQEDEKVYRNSCERRFKDELEDSLRRLDTDYIDLYQVHWPDDLVPVKETAKVMAEFLESGKIRAVGVSNYSTEQMQEFMKYCPLHSSQPPYNLFERGVEHNVLAFANERNITTLAYGAICRGLLSGRMTASTTFPKDDLRSFDPKFQKPLYDQYLTAVEALDRFAREKFDRRVIHLAVRWILDRGQTIALWGARRPEQLDGISQVFGWRLEKEDLAHIDQIIEETVTNPVGPEFMGSPDRSSPAYKGAYSIS